MKQKLDTSKVPEIRERLANGETAASIARDFCVPWRVIGDIKSGRTYKPVAKPRYKAFGSNNPYSKITEQQAAHAKYLHSIGKKRKEIEKLTGVPTHTVASIAAGRVWCDVKAKAPQRISPLCRLKNDMQEPDEYYRVSVLI